MNTNHVTHQLKLSSWADKFRDQQASGMTAKAWCTLNNITKDQFFYWKRQLKDACFETQLPDIVPISLPSANESSTTCTTCATVIPTAGNYAPATSAPAIQLQIKDVTINVTPDTPDALISKVLKAVRHA